MKEALEEFLEESQKASIKKYVKESINHPREILDRI